MKYFYTLLLAFVLLPDLLLAQNLVPNPSFEDTTACPHWLGHFYAVGWSSPTYGSPDLFHTCSTGQLGVPENVLGWQQPRTGLAYAGGHASDFSGGNGREYIQCRLNEPLEAGEKYEVSFWLSRADSATKACDNIGAYFSATPVSALDPYNLPYIPQIVSQPNSPVTDAFNWTQVIDTFTAIGGEDYLTIGIFTDDANTNWTPTLEGFFPEPYYYIDDVSVEKVLINFIEEHLEEETAVFPNPSDGEYWVNSKEKITRYTLYSSLGGTISSQIVDSGKLHINLNTNAAGIYFLVLEINNSLITHKLILTTKP